jgi:hypothetical protein
MHMKVNVILWETLAQANYGSGCPKGDDGALQVALDPGARVQDVIERLGVPSGQVALIRINGHKGRLEANVRAGDRIDLIPQEVASSWRHRARLNLCWKTPAA